MKVFQPDIEKPVLYEIINFSSLEKGIYPGDFWQLQCEKCT